MTDFSRTIVYVGYYDTLSNHAENRGYVPSATSKMDYILEVLRRLSFNVQVVSASQTRSRRGYSGKEVLLSGGHKLLLFRTLPWGGRVRRVTSRAFTSMHVLLWLLLNTASDETVLVYHSLAYSTPIALAQRLRSFRLILEVEEIYADVTGRKRDRRRESRVFRAACAFVLPTPLLVDAIGAGERPYAIVHGTYAIEPRLKSRFDDGKIHVVYAGTFDPRKGGAAAAVAAAEFLSERYHVHIIGFGTECDKQSLLNLIEEIQRTATCVVTYDGLLVGRDYVEFLQRCDIGLSTQTPDAEFNDTSFPSKVLSYMSNGLRVVSIRLKALEDSRVGDLLYYYDDDSPQAIASAIQRVDFDDRYDSRARLMRLDDEFARALEEVLCG